MAEVPEASHSRKENTFQNSVDLPCLRITEKPILSPFQLSHLSIVFECFLVKPEYAMKSWGFVAEI